MTALTKFFFRAPYSAPRTGEIWRWWESRRPAYNLAVLAAGLTTIATAYGAMTLMGAVDGGGFPWGPILIYGILANLFYTLGPIADTIVMRKWGREFSEVGPALFRYGFAFAVGLTLLPVPILVVRVLVGLLFGF